MANSGGSWFGPGDTADDAPRRPTDAGGDAGESALVPRPAEHSRAVLAQVPVDHPAAGDDTVIPGHSGGEPVIGLPEAVAWIWRNRILLAGLVLIAAQLVWKALFLKHFFFWQDDFHDLNLGLDNRFSWGYLVHMGSGHLIPGLYAVSWVLARIGLYDWALASGVTLVMLAAASLAALRLLRTLFGDRPAILIPLTVYLITPLTLPDLGWWSSAVESLPLQLATFMALNSHVLYVRRGHLRHAAAAAIWLAVGMIFFEKGAVLPLLLFAVTSAFFVDGRWPTAAWRCLVAYWKAWLLYAAVLAGYVILIAVQLHTSSAKPSSPGAYRNVLTFLSELVKNTFVPGAFGGPWQWLPSGALAYSAPPTGLVWLSWIAAAAIVAASIWNRRYAWRAWAILAGWIAVADMAPVVIGRIKELSGAVLGLETRYVADAVPILAICLGLAFWPVEGRRDSRRAHRESARNSQLVPAATGALLGAFILGSLWSAQAYESATTSVPARTYITNARAALAAAPHGTVVVDQQVPSTVTLGTFGQYSFASKVIGEMARGEPASRLRWTRQPDGTIDHLMVFGPDGRLRQVAPYGTAANPPLGQSCWPQFGQQVVTRFPSRVTASAGWTLHFAYLAPAAMQATVTFGGQSHQVTLQRGVHSAYLPVQGTGGRFVLRDLGSSHVCVGIASVGALLPVNSGTVIPATPAASASG